MSPTSAAVHQAIPALAALAGMIGDPAVRSRGTIGGSLANNDPAADYPAAALALGATIVTNKRELAAEAFFKGLFETALGDGEIIVKVRFPIPEKASYEKFRNPASRFALVGVFVAKTKGGVRVAVTGAGSSGVFRAKALEAALDANFAAAALKGATVAGDGAEYGHPCRRRLSRASDRRSRPAGGRGGRVTGGRRGLTKALHSPREGARLGPLLSEP